MSTRFRFFLALSCAFAGALLTVALAAAVETGTWGPSDAVVCKQADSQDQVAMAPDGSGGAIIVWSDNRNIMDEADIYAQRVYANGTPAWQADGVSVCTMSDLQNYPEVAPDGSGGAIVVWTDYRSDSTGSDIVAQRVDASGNLLWNTRGVTICSAVDNQGYPQIVPDGTGGAVITWEDPRDSATTGYDIYAQRVNASGAVQWATDGVSLCVWTDMQENPKIVSDGSSGAIVTWTDYRYTSSDIDIFAQRVLSDGTTAWNTGGVYMSFNTYTQEKPRIASDGAGGAIVVWEDYYDGSGGYSNIYAQRVNASGTIQWGAYGYGVCTVAGDQNHPRIVSNGSGGAIITWQDDAGRPGSTTTGRDIYAQRVDSNGSMAWAANGVSLCTASNTQEEPKIASDGAGGAFVAWKDQRDDPSGDFFAQRVDSQGNVLWKADGITVSTKCQSPQEYRICSDQPGGAILTWVDQRDSFYTLSDIYAQKLGQAVALPLMAKRE